MTENDNPRTLLRRRLRRTAGQLMEDSSLRSQLTDDKAQQLLDWGLEQVKQKGQETADLPDEEAKAILEERVTAVRAVMQTVNQLMGPLKTADDEPLTENHILNDITTRLLKNMAWLTGKPANLTQLMQVERFNQSRQNPDEAFQHLMALIQTPAAPSDAPPTSEPPPAGETPPPQEPQP